MRLLKETALRPAQGRWGRADPKGSNADMWGPRSAPCDRKVKHKDARLLQLMIAHKVCATEGGSARILSAAPVHRATR